MSDPPTEEDVLDRGEVDRLISQLEAAESSCQEREDDDFGGKPGLYGTAADTISDLAARIEALEAEREGLRGALDRAAGWLYVGRKSLKQSAVDRGVESDMADAERAARRALEES